jgi:hypothetical protein
MFCISCLLKGIPVIPLVELDIVLIVEPLGLGLRVDPELLGLLPEGVAVLTRVLRYLRPETHDKRGDPARPPAHTDKKEIKFSS